MSPIGAVVVVVPGLNDEEEVFSTRKKMCLFKCTFRAAFRRNGDGFFRGNAADETMMMARANCMDIRKL